MNMSALCLRLASCLAIAVPRLQGIRMLAEQGDVKLADLALPAEAFLESTKLRCVRL